MEEQLLLSTKQPSPAQARAIGIAAAVFLVAFLASLPFRLVPLAEIRAFIPIVDTVLLLGDLLTATLLFAQVSVLRSRALIALATGYLFTALIIIPHGLTFPGAFSPTGLLGAKVSTTIWLYFFWHLGLPLAVIGYALLKRTDAQRPMAPEHARRTVAVCVVGCVLIVIALTVLATRGERLLPTLMTDGIHWLPARVMYLALLTFALLGIAIALVFRGRRSILDLWLLLALWAWLLEIVLVMATSMRYSGGWYTGRLAGLLAGVVVLLMLLSETNKLYARLALAVTQQQRERDARLLTVNAVAASFAHETKQPLAAIVADAATAQLLLGRHPVDRAELTEILSSIEQEGHRAAEAVNSIQSMFTRHPTDRVFIDVNALVRDTANLIGSELVEAKVSLQLELHDYPAGVLADRRQLQQVFLNLFTNAIEAMAGVDERARVLTVRGQAAAGDKVRVSIEDTGPGFSPELASQLFDAFFTTKPQGTGVGLLLCREIVERHGGRLIAETRAPQGATFHVELPLQADPRVT
jgi:signal transduction histidine kinase